MRITRERHTDRALLDMLARRDRGETASQIAKAHRITKNAVIGLLWRIDRDCLRAGDTARSDT
jgi:hypothetical protein